MSSVEAVFGPDLAHLSAAKAARKSRLRFVRGKNELGVLYEFRHNLTGHVLTAWEAYQAYGLNILEESLEYGSAILIRQNGIEPTLQSRMTELGLQRSAVARETGLGDQDLERTEHRSADNRIGDLERIGFSLGLDELQLGYRPTGQADKDLAVRLKTLQPPQPIGAQRLSPRAVLSFAHAASVIRTQHRLQRWLGREAGSRFEPTDDYGTAVSPAYQVGYELARQARRNLSLGDGPVGSMRALVETTLGIPVIQAELPRHIAGATIAVEDPERGEARGIVLNTIGANENVWVRRATLAHELGHLLFDPIQHLDRVRVDTYQSNEIDPQAATDRVEQRANAFAIAFLAPIAAVREMAPASDSVSRVMARFGISHTAARHHVRNSRYGQYDVPDDIPSAAPSDEQKAAENFTIDYFPIRSTPLLRRGRFAEVVTSSLAEGYISEDSAATYMNCSKTELQDKMETIMGLYAPHQSG